MNTCPYNGSECIYDSKRQDCRVCEDCKSCFAAGASVPDAPSNGGAAEPAEQPPEPANDRSAEQTDEQLLSTKTSKPLQVFISYAHAQRPIVTEIERGLKRRGHDVKIDSEQIREGEDWRERITEIVKECKIVLFFISRDSIRKSGVCRDEIEIAVNVNHECLRTVLLEPEEELGSVPAYLIHRQWVDMSDWQARKAEGENACGAWFREKLARIIRVVESDENQRFIREIDDIRKALGIQDTTISRRGWYLNQPYVGREWLSEQIEAWLNDSGGGHLCAVYGGPGMGKSAFTAHFSYYNRYVAASLFFERGNTYFNSPDAIIRELVYQLAYRLSSYRSLLVQTLQSRRKGQKLNLQEMYEQLLSKPLQRAVDGGHETLCVVIDGLDECTEEERGKVVRLLKAERFPGWLRVLVACRPERDLTNSMKPDRVIELAADAEANVRDIQDYYAKRLERPLEGRPDRERLLNVLTRRSQGVFLYAFIVTDMILKNKLSIDDTRAYPRDLNASFEAWFSQYFPDMGQFNRFYRLTLGIIAACGEPVPLEELATADGYYDPVGCRYRLRKRRSNERPEGMNRRLAPCASLLKFEKDMIGNTTVSLTHRYIAEWLTGTGGADGPGTASRYFCEPSDAMWALEHAWRKRLAANCPMTDFQALHLLTAMERAGEESETIKKVAASAAWGNALAEKREYYRERRQWKMCLLLSVADVDRCNRAFGPERFYTLVALDELANAFSALGMKNDALETARQIYETWKRLNGEDDSVTMLLLTKLAVRYSEVGRYEDAMIAVNEAYESLKRLPRGEDINTLRTLNNIGVTYSRVGNYEIALQIYKEVYDALKRKNGEADSDMLTVKDNMLKATMSVAGQDKAMAKRDGAYDASEGEAEKIPQSALEPLDNAGGFSLFVDRDEEALKTRERAEDTLKPELEEKRADAQTQLNRNAAVYSDMDHEKMSLNVEKLLYKARRQVLGDDHPDTLLSQDKLRRTYSALGESEASPKSDAQVSKTSGRQMPGQDPAASTSRGKPSAPDSAPDTNRELNIPPRQIYGTLKLALSDVRPDIMKELKNRRGYGATEKSRARNSILIRLKVTSRDG